MHDHRVSVTINLWAHSRFPLSKKAVLRIAKQVSEEELSLSKTLKNEQGVPCSLNLRIVTGRQMRALNRDYLGKDRETDVVSFSYLEEFDPHAIAKEGEGFLIGDVAVSFDAARRACRKYGNSFKKELMLYIIHGVLHAFGYDDIDPRKRARMLKKQKDYISKFYEQRPVFHKE